MDFQLKLFVPVSHRSRNTWNGMGVGGGGGGGGGGGEEYINMFFLRIDFLTNFFYSLVRKHCG